MKSYRYILIVMLVALAVFSTPVLASTFSFTEGDSGKTVNVNPGDTIIVSLHENPSTGYRWIMDTSWGMLSKGDYYTASNTGLIGSGGVHTWNYLVTASGTLNMSGIYKQAWMPTTGDEDVFTLTLVSGERAFRNSRIWNWWDGVPQANRISLAAEKIQAIKSKISQRSF